MNDSYDTILPFWDHGRHYQLTPEFLPVKLGNGSRIFIYIEAATTTTQWDLACERKPVYLNSLVQKIKTLNYHFQKHEDVKILYR